VFAKDHLSSMPLEQRYAAAGHCWSIRALCLGCSRRRGEIPSHGLGDVTARTTIREFVMGVATKRPVGRRRGRVVVRRRVGAWA
jgi:hypothetical protein